MKIDNWKLKISPHKGFTLAEILIVVTIIVVLGLAVLVGINPMAQILKGYDAHRRSDLYKIKTALENYHSDHESYPIFPKQDGNGRNTTYDCDSDFLSPYLSSMPCDPNTNNPYLVYLLPLDSTKPAKFAVYAPINFKGDPYANLIPSCSYTIAVNSPDITTQELTAGCFSGGGPIYYACHDFSCVPVSNIVPNCNPNFYNDPLCGGGSEVDCPAPKNIEIENCQ